MTCIVKRAWLDRYAQRVPIIGTDRVVYSAWEPTELMFEMRHSTITHLDPENPAWFGRTGTEKLPIRIELMQDVPCHLRAHDEWRRSTYETAYEVILTAFPELDQEYLFEATSGHRLDREDGQIIEWLK